MTVKLEWVECTLCESPVKRNELDPRILPATICLPVLSESMLSSKSVDPYFYL